MCRLEAMQCTAVPFVPKILNLRILRFTGLADQYLPQRLVAVYRQTHLQGDNGTSLAKGVADQDAAGTSRLGLQVLALRQLCTF
jgi:hypothetical protein